MTEQQQRLIRETNFRDVGLYPLKPVPQQWRFPLFDHDEQPIGFQDLQLVNEIRLLKKQLDDPDTEPEIIARAERRLQRLRTMLSSAGL